KAATSREQNNVTKEELLKEGLQGLAGVAGKVFERFDNLKLLFVQADSPMKPEMFCMISAAAAAFGLVIAFFSHTPIPLFPVFALCFGVMPLMWMFWRRKRRFRKFAMQLPDAMELIARALRSGHSLASGLNLVVTEMPDPVAKEFGMAYEEQNLGVPIET